MSEEENREIEEATCCCPDETPEGHDDCHHEEHECHEHSHGHEHHHCHCHDEDDDHDEQEHDDHEHSHEHEHHHCHCHDEDDDHDEQEHHAHEHSHEHAHHHCHDDHEHDAHHDHECCHHHGEHAHHDHECCHHHDHHDHHDAHHHHEASTRPALSASARVFILEGLDCPNCAQKVEDHVAGLPFIRSAVVTYANLQLRVDSDEEELTDKLQAAIDEVEEGIHVVEKKRSSSGSTTVYILEGLDCPNCAQKIEDHLNSLKEIDDAVITYANLQCRIRARGSDQMTGFLQKVIDEVEEGITVVRKEEIKKAEKTQQTDQKSKADPLKKALHEIYAGALIFLIPFLAQHLGGYTGVSWLQVGGHFSWASVLFVIAYVILGRKVLKTAWSNIKRGQMFDENFLMAVATLGAFGLGLYSGSFEFDEAVGVMLFYRIGEYFEQKATIRSRSQIMDAVDLRPEVVNLCQGGEVLTIDAGEANVGDIVLVRPGDRIPLDGIVVEGESRIDTSPVTGEPVPVRKATGDSVISGCVNTSGVLKIRVEKVLEESMVTRILDSVENAAASKPKIDRFITRFSRIYTPAVVILALAVALLPSLLGALAGIKVPFIAAAHPTTPDYVSYWVTTALTFLVISCPCALVLSVPLAFFSGIGAASEKGILFKGGLAIESLNKVKAVVMDKTGTVTEGNFAVQEVNTSPVGAFTQDELLMFAAAAEMTSTHPIGVSIVEAARQKKMNIERPQAMEEIAGKGIRAQIAGHEVLAGNRSLMEQFSIDLTGYEKESFGTEVMVAVDGRYAGDIVIADTIKKDAKEAIRRTKALGIVTAMLTGDTNENAKEVAKETGIDEVYARLLPQDKLDRLTQIRKKHGSVMFVGDGINDAPVLAGADVGAAMGSGADAAIEAADVVFMTSAMDAIPQALHIARATSAKSWQNVYFALAVKIIVMLLGLLGFANMWLAVFADTGVSMLCLLNSMLILKMK